MRDGIVGDSRCYSAADRSDCFSPDFTAGRIFCC